MGKTRSIGRVLHSIPTIEGAGVRLKRAFGHREAKAFDPFLLLDDFHSENPQDYIAGFPWHPHRGIETVTYMIDGQVKHEDSMGNSGVVGSGDIQWMTAGSGIIHQEMPQQRDGLLWGFQLWANLPSAHKMMKPRYQDIQARDIPEVEADGGARVRIIAGRFGADEGPVRDIVTNPEYLDVSLPPDARFTHEVEEGHNLFAYILSGEGYFDTKREKTLAAESLVHYNEGTEVTIQAERDPLRFLLISGRPIGDPIAWHGPIVMNTEDELQQAFNELREGTFIKT
jgi:redox-sensitive bicupin YhaK (pirin superfamily)